MRRSKAVRNGATRMGGSAVVEVAVQTGRLRSSGAGGGGSVTGRGSHWAAGLRSRAARSGRFWVRDFGWFLVRRRPNGGVDAVLAALRLRWRRPRPSRRLRLRSRRLRKADQSRSGQLGAGSVTVREERRKAANGGARWAVAVAQ